MTRGRVVPARAQERTLMRRVIQRGLALAAIAAEPPPLTGQGTLLGEVMTALSLDALDQDLICLVLAAQLDAAALQAITAHAGEPALTVAAATQLLGRHAAAAELPVRCLVESPLRRAGFVEVILPPPGVSWLRARLMPSARLLALAHGRIELSTAVADVASLLPADADAADGVAIEPALDDVVALGQALQAARRQRGPIAIVGAAHTGRLRAALAVAARAGRRQVIVVDARLVAGDPQAWRTLSGQLVTESVLHMAPVVLRDPGPAGIAAAWKIARAGVPCLFTGGDELADSAARVIARVARPAGATQQAAWEVELARGATTPSRPVSRPPLTRSEIATVVALAERPPPGREGPGWFELCARSQLHSRLDRFAQVIPRRVRLDDLVLSRDLQDQICELIAALLARPRLDAVWRLGPILQGCPGVAALFEGPPGTGKTMCAAVVATELGVPLFRIDVSSIVDRYVGETEKNLQRVFREAAATRGILLFDEADSLFARRVETKDAMDRFANMQVNQLLNLIEDHPGISILTTNLSQGLDAAFARRIPYKIRFELPDVEERIALWQLYLPPGQLGDAAIADLAARYDRVSGADIRNAVIRAASQAIGTATLTAALVGEALVSEIRASGRIARSYL